MLFEWFGVVCSTCFDCGCSGWGVAGPGCLFILAAARLCVLSCAGWPPSPEILCNLQKILTQRGVCLKQQTYRVRFSQFTTVVKRKLALRARDAAQLCANSGASPEQQATAVVAAVMAAAASAAPVLDARAQLDEASAALTGVGGSANVQAVAAAAAAAAASAAAAAALSSRAKTAATWNPKLLSRE